MSTPAFAESWVPGPKKTNFYTRSYSLPSGVTPKAHLVFVHGFAEHIARYEHVFPLWVEHSISVFAFDQRGFGKTGTHDFKSPTSSWGKTSWEDQMQDIEFFVERERERLGSSVPIFLMGHSMGGGEALGFAAAPPTPKKALSQLSGIISSSPLIILTTPPPKWKTWIGGKAAALAPTLLIDAPVEPSHLSRDPAVGKAYLADPLVRQSGTLKGLGDMLGQGEKLATAYYKNWPSDLPVLILHGSDDKVNSFVAAKKFFEDIPAKDKEFKEFPGGYHELVNEADWKIFVGDCIAWVEKHAIARNSAEAKL